MRIPKITSLYGRIFAIFWFTLLLVVMAAILLPHLDPRNGREISQHEQDRLEQVKQRIESVYQKSQSIGRVLFVLERDFPPAPPRAERNRNNPPPEPPLAPEKRVNFFLTDDSGHMLTARLTEKNQYRAQALRTLMNGLENQETAKQRLIGRYRVTGPLPVTLGEQTYYLYSTALNQKGLPFILQVLNRPYQLLLAIMLVSTPFLLWLAWALSQPARRLELAAQRVSRGEFVSDPALERGPSEFRQAGKSFNQMVAAVNQMINGQQRLLSNISHELRSPLTRLQMANALAIRKQGTSAELERVETEAQRLEAMIAELLKLSRTQVDTHTDREQISLQALWGDILSDAKFEAQQMAMVLNYPVIPDREIQGTPSLLMSVMDNLVRNAIYYGNQRVQIEFLVEKDNLTVKVSDDGDGVPEEELDAIFRPFYRVSTARDRHSGGTGLGLAITESAILKHNGSIHANLGSLGGLTVSFTLPLVTK